MGEQCNRMVQARRVARDTEFLIAAKRVAGRWVAAAAKLGLKHIRASVTPCCPRNTSASVHRTSATATIFVFIRCRRLTGLYRALQRRT